MLIAPSGGPKSQGSRLLGSGSSSEEGGGERSNAGSYSGLVDGPNAAATARTSPVMVITPSPFTS